MVKMVGFDFEEVVWGEVVDMACELEGTLRDFRGAWQLCERAQRHYRETFQLDAGALPS